MLMIYTHKHVCTHIRLHAGGDPVAWRQKCSTAAPKETSSNFSLVFRTNTIGKVMNPIDPSALGQIVWLLFFYKDYIDIK